MDPQIATDAEVDAALAARRDAEAKKAASEIMGEAADADGPPPLKAGEHPIPDPPPDWLILRLEKPFRYLQDLSRKANTIDRDAFDKEVRERFAEEGIVVDVKWWYSGVPGVYIPEVEPYALSFEPDEDHDRQVYDVTHDTLGISEPGTVKAGLWTPGGG